MTTPHLLERWVALGPNPCAECRNNDDRTMPPGGWAGRYPAHPNCLCVIVTEETMSQPPPADHFQLASPPIALAANRRYACTLLQAGPLKGHSLHLAAEVLQRDAAKFAQTQAFVDHHSWPKLEALLGIYEDVAFDPASQAITATLVLKATPAANWLARLIDELIADQDKGSPALDIGLSADVWLDIGPRDEQSGQQPITAIREVSSVDVVFRPASDGARFDRILAQAGPTPALPADPSVPSAPSQPQEVPMTTPIVEPAEIVAPPAPPPAPAPVQAQAPVPARNAAAGTPPPSYSAPASAPPPSYTPPASAPPPAPSVPASPPPPSYTPAASPPPPARSIAETPDNDLAAELAALRQQFSDLAARQAITGFDTPRPQPITAAAMATPADQAQQIVDWMFGVQDTKLPEPAMRTPRAFYHALTGDFSWQGSVVPTQVQFASASTTNLADLAANAMNKVLIQQWPGLDAYRWFEQVVTVAPNDGSVHDMAWIQFGGISNLPQVVQGGTYTELNVADSRENDSFAKYGGYVGVTIEMWRNNDMQQMHAIPRALAVAAVRTRSAAIAGIFTATSGTGPTLDDDSTVLFHSTHGSNVQTTALSVAAWKAARLECFKMAELGSGKPLGLYPKYALIPADLWDDALVYFGYGAGPGGYPGTANNDTHPYALGRSSSDPRPVPVVVPDWSDANDWAYLVDKALHPVIMMTYAQNPGGGSHPMPELFSVASPTAGLVFSNDVLPIKVRDWFSYGVATWRGVGKRNVT